MASKQKSIYEIFSEIIDAILNIKISRYAYRFGIMLKPKHSPLFYKPTTSRVLHDILCTRCNRPLTDGRNMIPAMLHHLLKG